MKIKELFKEYEMYIVTSPHSILNGEIVQLIDINLEEVYSLKCMLNKENNVTERIAFNPLELRA